MFAISLNPIDWVTTAAGELASAAGGAIFGQITNWVEDGLRDLADQAAGQLAGIGTSQAGDATIMQLGGVLKWVALVTVVVTLLLGAAGSLLGNSHQLSNVIREVPVTLMMLAGWYGFVSVLIEATNALTRVFLSDALLEGLAGSWTLDPTHSSFMRMLMAALLLIFLFIFVVEMMLLSHLLTIAAVVGPLSIALRPWPGLRDVSARMVANLVTMSMMPPLAVVSLALALRVSGDGEGLGFGAMLASIAGMAISILMPALVARFLPLGGSGGTGARALVAAGAGTAAVAAGVIATGGAGAAAGAAGAGGAGGAGGAAPGALNPATLGASSGSGSGSGSSSGGSLPSGAMAASTVANAAGSAVDEDG